MKLLVDAEATVAAVSDFLTKEIPSQLTADTPFLVYFAGHGVAENDDGGAGPQGYLILQDSVLAKRETWLSMDVFRAALNALACKHLLVVLDCCYAGAFRWATATRDIGLAGQSTLYRSVYDRYLEGEAWQALTSASAAQRAADSAQGLPNLRDVNADGHSPFAAALLDGLAGAADYSTAELPPDGVITATELYQYLTTCLMPAPDVPATQTPGIWPLRPDNAGEFVFLNPKVPLKVAPDPPLDDSNNPWLGLEAYTAASKDLFFGRMAETAELVKRVTGRRSKHALLAVVGASGAGKSSLVQAGLVPALDASKWAVVESARLADDPNPALAAAIKELDEAPKHGRRLLIIDQFEDLFTQCPDDGERAQFLTSLRRLVDEKSGPVVVLTLRSDFELRASEDESLKDIWQAARYQVPPFSGDELRQVILAPAQVTAVYYDPAGIGDDLFDEVSRTPGALPLLSFALAELYRQAQLRRRKSGAADRALTTADYDAIGGVVGALNRRATQLYEEASPEEQQAIRRVFPRLVTQEASGLVARRVEKAELQFGNAEDPEQLAIGRVVQRYVDAGLLVIDGDSVAPAHDALVVEWQLLHDWLKAGESLDLIRAGWTAASSWEAHGRAAAYLWSHDPRLPLLAAAHRAGELNATERAFETASTKRRKARRRLITAVTTAIIVALSAASVITIGQRNTAIAQRNAAASLALATAADATRATNPPAALLLGLAAYRASPTVQAESSMLSTLQWDRSHGLEGIIDEPTSFPLGHSDFNITSVVLSPHGNLIAVGDNHGGLLLGNTRTHKLLGWLATPGSSEVMALAFSPDGNTLADAEDNGTVVLWNTHTFAQRGQLKDPKNRNGVNAVAYSPNGSTLAAADENGTVDLWNTRSLKLRRPPLRDRGSGGGVSAVAFSADGKTLAAGDFGGKVLLWHTRTYTPLGAPLKEATWTTITQLAFDPNGGPLAVLPQFGPVVLFNPRTFARPGTPLRDPKLKHQAALAVAFSPDGSTLASLEDNGTMPLWKTRTALERGRPLKVPGFALTVAFGADGTLAAGEVGGTVVLWNARTLGEHGLRQLGPLKARGVKVVSDVAFSPDGGTLAAADDNGTVALWNTHTFTERGAPLRSSGSKGIAAVAFSPDGGTLAAAEGNGAVTLWNARTHAPRGRPLKEPGAGGVADVAFSPDGTTLAAGYDNGTVVLWNTSTRTPLGPPLEDPGSHGIDGVAFSPDGGTLAVAGNDGPVLLWDTRAFTQRGAPLKDAGQDLDGVAFSPNGNIVAAPDFSGRVVLWNARTHAEIGLLNDPNSDQSPAMGVAFSPDGGTLAASGDTGTVAIWNVRKRDLIGSLPTSISLSTGVLNVGRVAFSRNGGSLAVAAVGTVNVWPGMFWQSFAGLKTVVCGLTWTPMTRAEWQILVPGLAYEPLCQGQLPR